MCGLKRRAVSRHQATRALLATLLALMLLIARADIAAQTASPDVSRRIKVAIKPEYSDLAKRLKLSGVVRVEVLIGADGKVKKAHVVGGHPVLALDAEKAALMTEFESATKESTQVLEFRFGSGS